MLSTASHAADPGFNLSLEVTHQTVFAQPVEIAVPAGVDLGGAVKVVAGDTVIHGQITAGEGDAAGAGRWAGDERAAALMKAPGVLRFQLPPDFAKGGHRLRIERGESAQVMKAEPVGARLRIAEGDSTTAHFQVAPLERPVGGSRFDAAAFFPSLLTPAGVEVLGTQPADHLHHMGLWWPWKYLVVDGKEYNTWEIQQGDGRMRCESTRQWGGPAAAVVRADIFSETGSRRSPTTIAHQDARFVMWRSQGAGRMLDIALADWAADGRKVVAKAYRYSGFSIRAAHDWDAKTSTLVTSEGKGRDDGHATLGRWLLINAKPKGAASESVSVLMLSRAAKLRGTPETFRIWDSKTHHGQIFANFNPVFKDPIELPASDAPALLRQYRVITADRVITAAEAETLWQAFAEPATGVIEAAAP